MPNERVLPENRVSYALRTLGDNRLYFGYLNRLYRLDDPDRLTLLHPPGLRANNVTSWLLDQSAVLWIGGR